MRGIVLAMVLAPIGIDEAPVYLPRLVPGVQIPAPWQEWKFVPIPLFEGPRVPAEPIPLHWPAFEPVPAGF